MTDEILSMGTGAHIFLPILSLYGGQIMLTPESIVWPSKTGKETGMLLTGKRQDTYYDSHAILFLYLRNGNGEMLPVASDMGSVGERINQERGRLKAGRIREKGGLVQKTDL